MLFVRGIVDVDGDVDVDDLGVKRGFFPRGFVKVNVHVNVNGRNMSISRGRNC